MKFSAAAYDWECNQEGVACLATSSAGQTGDYHIYRLTEGNTAQRILAADIAEPDVCTFKVLQPTRTSARLSAITTSKPQGLMHSYSAPLSYNAEQLLHLKSGESDTAFTNCT